MRLRSRLRAVPLSCRERGSVGRAENGARVPPFPLPSHFIFRPVLRVPYASALPTRSMEGKGGLLAVHFAWEFGQAGLGRVCCPIRYLLSNCFDSEFCKQNKSEQKESSRDARRDTRCVTSEIEYFDWSKKQPVNQVPSTGMNNNLFKSFHVVRLLQFLQTRFCSVQYRCYLDVAMRYLDVTKGSWIIKKAYRF